MVQNPLLVPSRRPYALPEFDRIDESHYLPAFAQAMAEHRAEIDAIAANPESPSVQNTIVALERSGRTLQWVSAVFFTQVATDATDRLQDIRAEVAPQLAAHHDAIHLDPRLFARIRALHDARAELGLDDETRRLVERYHQDFVRAGAGLTRDQQARLQAINEQLSTLAARFEHHLLADTNASAIVVDDVAQLDGLPADAVAAAAEAARDRGLADAHVLTLGLPTSQPVLADLADRSLRERVHRASIRRGANGTEHDNRALVGRIAALRAERAALLGHPNHATYELEDRTAKTPSAVHDMLAQLVPAAVANARAEAARLQEAIGDAFELRAWDWPYYARRVKRATFDLDTNALRPFFELERVLRDGVFYAATRLYGLTFTERPDLSAHHRSAQVFEVFEEDGSPLGLFIGDYFARSPKRGGAWMNSLVEQSRLLDQRPVVVNNLNIARPADGAPVLLTLDEVTTMFHEFGHALHGLFSDVTYPTFSGTSVQRDVVEFPSQVNEMWALWPEVVGHYARHHRTAEPLAPEVVQRLVDSRTWGEGFRTTEYLAATVLDLAWHELGPGVQIADVLDFERAVLERHGLAVPAIDPRYRSTYFAHIFANGYSAGYYSYIWSEVLDADAVEWFTENGGLTRANGDHFRRTLLSQGGRVDPMDAFRRFRGRDPRVEPLLRRRGLDAARTTP